MKPNPASAVDGGSGSPFAFGRAQPAATDRHLVIRCGCASSPASVSREQALHQAGANVVATIHEEVPYLPASAGSAVEGALALAAVALRAWNTPTILPPA